MNSTKQCVNSEPMWGYCSRARKKKKIKKGRKRRRDETRYPNTHYQVQNQDLNLGGQKHESKKFQMT